MAVTHGYSGTPTHVTWKSMKKRCNPGRADTHHQRFYSDRGVKVCERWQKFDAFLADMGVRPVGHTLDRIDVNGDYEPGNCRWATKAEQSANTRQNVRITANGETLHISEWARRIGVRHSAIWMRIHRYGWSPERAVTQTKGARL